MGNVGWQNWEAFGQFPVGISAKNQRHYRGQPAFFRHVSARNRPTVSDRREVAVVRGIRVRQCASIASESYCCPAQDRQLRYGTGIQYEITRDVTAGAAWEFMDACRWFVQQYPRTARRNAARAFLDELSLLCGAQCHLEILEPGAAAFAAAILRQVANSPHRDL